MVDKFEYHQWQNCPTPLVGTQSASKPVLLYRPSPTSPTCRPTWPHRTGQITLSMSPWSRSHGRITLAVSPRPYRPGRIALTMSPDPYRPIRIAWFVLLDPVCLRPVSADPFHPACFARTVLPNALRPTRHLAAKWPNVNGLHYHHEYYHAAIYQFYSCLFISHLRFIIGCCYCHHSQYHLIVVLIVANIM